MSYFKVFYGLAAFFSLGVLAAWRIANHAEKQQWWTLRFRLSLLQPYVLTGWIFYTVLTLIVALYDFQWGTLNSTSRIILPDTLIALVTIAILIIGADLSLSAFGTRRYLSIRWKAWTGPSRTGIPSVTARYIGTSEDWIALAQTDNVQQHPVERFAGSFMLRDNRILQDPTDLLRTKVTIDQDKIPPWPKGSQQMSSVYHPINENQTVSLLWGEHLGFQRRCSRGIISVPPNMLKTSPLLKSGLSGNAVCLAYGILARNKGLEPATLICNLQTKNTFREFEESGHWPHPAKTLRGYYYSEFSRTFSLLGPSYVTAATELAILLADTNTALIGGWLDSHFEHQDLLLNREVHALGANEEDLRRIYRGHYATMLISLCLYRKGVRIRPEITVFDAVCKLEGIEQPVWAGSTEMEARRQWELDEYGPELQHLVAAVI
ncbi:hypothetical protein N7494_013040 [Penicillium frequentans]|uniref:Uncharacterized protein n=1 Tax=Penicillium frequentans TaxID=3151616 RepID=A0AAD6CMZ2_9EURO|nr:hypothetical protein N7494_013040 [Penicillium glabrum]